MQRYGQRGRYIGPLFDADDAGGSGGGDSTSGGASGAPPSLPPPPPPASPAPAGGGSGSNAGGAGNGAPAKPARKRKPAQPKPAAKPKAPANENVTVTIGSDPIQKIADLPTPGGLVLMLVLLLLLLFAVVPVSGGKTRLQLLFDTLRGKTQLPDANAQAQAASAQAASQSALNSGIAAGLTGNPNDPVSQGIAAGLTGFGSGVPMTLNSGNAGEPGPIVPESTAGGPYAYVDAWEGPQTPQGYYGETVYDSPDFPELVN